MSKTIALAAYPQQMDFDFASSVEMQMELFQSVVNCIREIRKQYNIKENDITPIEIYFSNKVQKFWFDAHGYGLAAFVKGPVAFLDGPGIKKDGTIAGVVANALAPVEVHIDLGGLVHKDRELIKIEKEIADSLKEINKLDAVLSNSGFMKRAPANLVLKKKTARDSLVESVARLEEIRKSFRKKS